MTPDKSRQNAALLERVKHLIDHAKGRRFIAVSIDIADADALLATIERLQRATECES